MRLSAKKVDWKIVLEWLRRFRASHAMEKLVLEIADWAEYFDDPDEAVAWKRAGFSAIEALEWVNAGFDIAEAMDWSDAGFSPDEAVAWADYGFDPEVARTYYEKGYSADEAYKKWREIVGD
jgi:hypothetical protein